MEDIIYRGWETQEVTTPRGNSRVAAPGALAPQIVPMDWVKYLHMR
jgi:hypothetical protein